MLNRDDIDESISALEHCNQGLEQRINQSQACSRSEAHYIQLLRESLDCLLSSCPPKGGRTDLLCRRIKKALR